MKQWEIRSVELGLVRAALAQEAPARSTAPKRVPLDQIPAVIWTTDSDLVFTSSLGSRLESLGLGPNQLVGTAVSELFETDDYDDEPIEAHRRALNGESVSFEIRWVDRTYRARVGPLRDALGLVIGTVCVALDETQESTTAPGRDPRPAVASTR